MNSLHTPSEGPAATSQTRVRPIGSRPSSRPVARRTVRSRMPGDPSAPRARTHRLVGHALTSPQKRTLKRLEAMRAEHMGDANLRVRVMAQLLDDRDMATTLSRNAMDDLADQLTNVDNAAVNTTVIVGDFLRCLGAMQRPELNAPRVKMALRVLNETLFGADQKSALALGVREFKLEKRDGGLQIVAVLRRTGDFDAVRVAAAALLVEHKLKGVDIRVER